MGCNSLFGVVIDSTAVSAWSEASVLTVIWVSGIQWVRTSAVVKSFLSASKADQHSSVKFQIVPFWVRCEWYSDFGVSINEVSVEVGKTQEILNVFDLPGFMPILDNLDFVWHHGEAFR